MTALSLSLEALGERISIVGLAYAGKSTLAVQLGDKLGLPVIHLDQLRFKNEYWEKDSEFLNKVSKLVCEDRWIIEGSYPAALQLQLPMSTSVIHLTPTEVTRYARYTRLCKRIKDGKEMRLGIPENAPTPFSLKRIVVSLWKARQESKLIERQLVAYRGIRIIAPAVSF